jgi:hypothetical protein
MPEIDLPDRTRQVRSAGDRGDSTHEEGSGRAKSGGHVLLDNDAAFHHSGAATAQGGAGMREWKRLTRRIFSVVLGVVTLAVVGVLVGLKLFVFTLDRRGGNPADYAGTERMAARLKELAAVEDLDGIFLFFPFSPLYPYYAKMHDPPAARFTLLSRTLAAERLLMEGKSAEAVAALEAVRTELGAQPTLFDAHFLPALGSIIAIGHLRVGEQANCLARHNADSCLLPLQGEGQHRNQEGARAAIREYLDVLRQEPDDRSSRWLLNIAYMAVGEYPSRVPKEFLVPPEAFQSDYPMPRFTNVASDVGLEGMGHAGSVIADDLDGDGYIDLMISDMGIGEQLRFFHNAGDGSFVERTAEAGLTGITGGLNLNHADYDNDGRPDVLVLRGGWVGIGGKAPEPASLLHSDGKGHWSDVTVQAGMLSFFPTQTAAWADFDNDGWVDVFIGYESMSMAALYNLRNTDRPLHLPVFQQHPAALYHNNGDGTFTNVAARAGVDVTGWIKGVAAGDYDRDGLPDIYVSRIYSDNQLLHNDGHLSFSDVTRKAGVAAPERSFGTFFFDYDNDGWPDIFVNDQKWGDQTFPEAAGRVLADFLKLGDRKPLTHLYRNRGDGTFTDVTSEVKLDRVLLTMGHNYGDLDHDGWLDVYMGTGNPPYMTLIPNRMFRNAGGKFFQDVTTAGDFGHLQKGHGIAFADFDEDGDQDVFVKQGGAFTGDVAQSALFANPGNSNHWIKLTLEGRQSNRSAIGAVVQLEVDTGEGPRTIYSTVSSGGSFGDNPFRRDLGVGNANVIKRMTIRWPRSGVTQAFTGVAVNRAYRVVEGQDALVATDLKPFQLHAR